MHQNIQVCSQIKFNKNIKWSNLEKNMYKELAGKAIRGVLNTPMFENSTALEAEFLIWDASIIYRTSYEYVKMLNKYKGRDYMNVEMALTAESIDNYIEKIKS